MKNAEAIKKEIKKWNKTVLEKIAKDFKKNRIAYKKKQAEEKKAKK